VRHDPGHQLALHADNLKQPSLGRSVARRLPARSGSIVLTDFLRLQLYLVREIKLR
jgi:hypothetical protein